MALYLLFGWTLKLEQSIRRKQGSISMWYQGGGGGGRGGVGVGVGGGGGGCRRLWNHFDIMIYIIKTGLLTVMYGFLTTVSKVIFHT